MAFCEFSNEVISKNSINIDNAFITDFLPNADGQYIKVYLYGLYLCANNKDNTLETFVRNLNMSEEDVLSIFYYWQEQGLVQVINASTFIIRYLPIKNAYMKLKKYNTDKYTAFNISAQELIGSKMLTPREFEEFYYIIENLHVEKEAVLRIIEYCVIQKGKNISVNYISTVAKNWAYDGVRTSEDVEGRIQDQERVSGDIIIVLKAMGIRRQATMDEYQMFLTWTKSMEIDKSLIVLIAKQSKSKSFEKLNEMVMKIYNSKLESEKEIIEYFDNREKMFTLAKSTIKALGLWYDDISTIVDTYIVNWLQLGFDNDAILKLANYAFKSSIRTLESFNNHIQNMFRLGILTSEAIDNYIDGIVKSDKEIAEILLKLNILRNVNSQDRTFYRTWIYDWGLNSEIINFAVDNSVGKYMPLQYLNKLLSEYHNRGVKSIDDARNIIVMSDNKTATKQTSKDAEKRDYSKKELDSLFDNIYEVEL